MEIRVLRYFLEVARTGNITHAAERLHITQPTLSRQLKDLETELGKKLFVRSSFSVRLTDEGLLLRKRAEDICEMVDKTAAEFKALDEITGGDIHIGCAESDGIKHLARQIKALQARHPRLCSPSSRHCTSSTRLRRLWRYRVSPQACHWSSCGNNRM